MEERFDFTVTRADTFPRLDERIDLPYHDKYVIHYDFSDVGKGPSRFCPPKAVSRHRLT
jgi:hypothetical protein